MNVSTLISQIEQTLQFEIDIYREEVFPTPYEQGVLAGLESALENLDKIVYEYDAIMDQQEYA